MGNKAIRDMLLENLREDILIFDEPMKNHTTFRSGGKCDVLAMPGSVEDIRRLNRLCKKNGIPMIVIGNGSNLLIREGGIRGVVLKLAENFCYATVSDNSVTAQAGALLSSIAMKAMNSSLSGLEFASGIPGTVGGGVSMNAGAYGGELRDVLSYSVYLDENGEIIRIGNEDHSFGYRHSMFSDKKYIIIESAFTLKPGNRAEIKSRMADLNRKRREKQPLALPNAGSVFKRPEGHYAGALIEQCGLMGYRIGGACVSTKHAGFIVNDRNGTSDDIERLMEYVKETVYNETGVALQPEIKIIGEK